MWASQLQSFWCFGALHPLQEAVPRPKPQQEAVPRPKPRQESSTAAEAWHLKLRVSSAWAPPQHLACRCWLTQGAQEQPAGQGPASASRGACSSREGTLLECARVVQHHMHFSWVPVLGLLLRLRKLVLGHKHGAPRDRLRLPEASCTPGNCHICVSIILQGLQAKEEQGLRHVARDDLDLLCLPGASCGQSHSPGSKLGLQID